MGRDSQSRIGLDIGTRDYKGLFLDKGASQIRGKKEASVWCYRPRFQLGCKEMGEASLLSPDIPLGASPARHWLKAINTSLALNGVLRTFLVTLLSALQGCSSRSYIYIYIYFNVHSLPMMKSFKPIITNYKKRRESEKPPWAHRTHIFILSKTRILVCTQFCRLLSSFHNVFWVFKYPLKTQFLLAVCYSLRSRHHNLFSCVPRVDYFPDRYYKNVSINDLLTFKIHFWLFPWLDSCKWGCQVKGQNTFKSLDGLFANCFPKKQKTQEAQAGVPTFTSMSVIFSFHTLAIG